MISSIYSAITPMFKSGSRKGKKRKTIQNIVDKQISHKPYVRKSKKANRKK